MGDLDALIAQAREAWERQEWSAACAAFSAARARDGLSPDDASTFADAAWWLGRIDDVTELTEEAHRGYLGDGRTADAARMALELGFNWALRGDVPMASGWFARADRLLAELPPAAEHGYLACVDLNRALGIGNIDEALAIADRIREIAATFDDPTLHSFAMMGEGTARLRRGEVGVALARFDEAMLPVLAGEMRPEMAGNLYCQMIALCHELHDLERMRHWTEVTQRWCDGFENAVMFNGICRIHRAQLEVVHGAWEHAEREAIRVSSELARLNAEVVAEALYQLGELHRLRGELDRAEAAYRDAHRSGRSPQPGLALLELARGRVADASNAITAQLRAENLPLRRGRLLPVRAEIALAAGDTAAATSAVDELDHIAATWDSPGFAAHARQWRGALLVGLDRDANAVPVLQDAVRRWQDLDAPYEVARCRITLARALRHLGDAYSARLELDAATRTFEDLGARPDLTAARRTAIHPEPPAGLTEREVEVLTCIADGRTNREAAATLYISEGTVARHLANIYRKIGVSTRTAAAAFARDHGLTG